MATPVTPQEAAKLIAEEGALLVDVREPDEYRSLRIQEAHLRPISVLPLMPEPLPSGAGAKTVIFFCHSGNRTKANVDLLESLAPGRARILEGGISAWQNVGLPVISEKRPWPIMRQVQVAAGSLILLSLALSLTAPGFLVLTAFIGAGLVFAGVSGFCGLARVLARMPWNKRL